MILNIDVLRFQVFEINESLYVVELKRSSGDCSLYRQVFLPPLLNQYFNSFSDGKFKLNYFVLEHCSYFSNFQYAI
jgi:hypothetical protein